MSRRNSIHIPWSKSNADIILIQNHSNGEFQYALTGNIQYKEDWVQGFNSTGYCSGNYYGGRQICYDGDNLTPYKQGMKEMCEMTKIKGEVISIHINRFIFHNGQQKKFPFVLGVYWYQRDMDKVTKFWKGSHNSGWTTNYVKCGSCDAKGGACNTCHGQKFITKQQEQKRKYEQIQSEERAKAQQRRAAEQKRLDTMHHFFNTPETKCTETDCVGGYIKEKWMHNKCTKCYGEGNEDFWPWCRTCNGKGTVSDWWYGGYKACTKCPASKKQTCTDCNGTGNGKKVCVNDGKQKCYTCHGYGFLVIINGDMYRVNYFNLDDFRFYKKKHNTNVVWIPFVQRQQKKERLRQEKLQLEKLRQQELRQEKALRKENELRARIRRETALRQKEQEQKAKQYTVVYASGAIIRKTEDISSDYVDTLPVGTIVLVEEISGRRCMISSQTNGEMLGWISLRTDQDVAVVRKTDDYKMEICKMWHVVSLCNFCFY